jgi:predicted dienelactone hydrolase
MRSFEVLLLLADLLTWLLMAMPRFRVATWMRFSATVALLIAAAQVLVEGPRWQMFPAYALTALFCLASLLMNIAPAAARAPRHRLTQVAIGLGAVWLAGSVALPMIAPVFRFPTPTGPHAIGTLTYHWVDASRSEVFAADARKRRELMVQVWYPASAQPSAPRAAYLPNAAAVTAALARILNKPGFVLRHLQYVTTNAVSFAPAAGDEVTYPVLIFLEGATGFRQMNTVQVEHLVSHGYIVVALDQPGAAAVVVFPDGHQAAGLTTLAQFKAAVGPSYLPERPNAPHNGLLGLQLPNGRVLKDNSIIPYLAQDVVFTLDQLVALNNADPNGILTGKLNLQRVGAFGISLGGIVVGEACLLDQRLRTCLVMDAAMPTDVVKAGLQQPCMWITRDAAGMRLERQRAGGWPEPEIEAHQTSMRAVYEGLSGAGYFVRVAGTFHFNFTDMPIWTPLAPQLGLAGPINAQRAHDIVNAYSLAFFDRHLLGRPAKLLDGPARQYPEVMLESRRP